MTPKTTKSRAAKVASQPLGVARPATSVRGHRPAGNPFKEMTTMTTMTKDQFETIATGAARAYGEAADIGKRNAEAAIKAQAAFAKGAQDISRALAAIATRALEAQASAVHAFAGCCDVNDVIRVQSDWVKAQLDTVLREGSKLRTLAFEVANETAKPLSEPAEETAKTVAKGVKAA